MIQLTINRQGHQVDIDRTCPGCPLSIRALIRSEVEA